MPDAFSRLARTVLVAITLATSTVNAAEASGSSLATASSGARIQHYPWTLPLPQGSVPEGIAIKDTTAFVTSLAHGTVYEVDLETGDARVLSPGNSDSAVGILLDEHGRLFVAGGRGGSVQVLDSDTGETLARYKLASTDTFINDFTQLGDAIYATDSFAPVIYKLPLGDDGALPAQEEILTIPLTGITYGKGFNANGISQTPDEIALLIVQTNTGLLFRVDAASGAAKQVDTGGVDLKRGDGMLREGNILYVVLNMLNTVAVLEINDAGTSARLKAELKSPGFDTPTTIARFRDRLYLPNARFTVKDPASADFTITAISYGP